MTTSEGAWEIETLIRNAFHRLKDRFLTYILAYVVMYAMVFGLTLLLALTGLFAAGMFAYKVTFMTGLLLALFTALSMVAFMYVVSFTQLVIVHVLIRKTKGTLMHCIREVKEDVWGFVWVSVAGFIFMVGLLPFATVSLFTIYILWSFWGSFTAFVYLTHKKKGLDNMWVSYAMVNQRFWGIVGRMALVFVTYFIIISILGFQKDNNFLSVLQFIVSMIFGPFVMSYQYEMFKHLKVPTHVVRPKIWIWMSIVGYVLMIFLLFSMGREVGKGGMRLREYFEENNQYQQMPGDDSRGVTLR